MPTAAPVEIYVEVGRKRVFVGALDWPGWCRGGRDEAAAIEALLAYGPRYAAALRPTRLGFRAPSAARVLERLTGDATTDFGAPGAAPSADSAPMDATDLRRAQTLLRACWGAFDRAAEVAAGAELRKGPRGGGRDLDRIIDHVREADGAYLAMIGRKLGREEGADLEGMHSVILDALAMVVRDGVPPSPRGGRRWTPRYFVRRGAWHVLDHAWEIEDRAEG